MKSVKIIFSLLIVSILASCASNTSKSITAESLFARHVDVAYGGKGMGVYDSITQTGTLFIDDFGVEAPLTIKVKAPGYMLFETDIMGMSMTQGCNTNGCWSQQPGQGTETLTGEMLHNIQLQADTRAWENMSAYYESMEIVPAENEAEASTYTVKAINKFNREHLYYFNKESGLLVGTDITTDSPMGVMTQQTTIKDYKDFGGVLWGATMEQSTSMATIRIVVDDVSYDELSEDIFTLSE